MRTVVLALAVLVGSGATLPDARVDAREQVQVERDTHGKIKRSHEAKKKFMQESGYPHGRDGYVIDHVVPLACGGADDPSNMQWQTKAEAKAKDKTERQGCGHSGRGRR
jgi:hypothetical protein